jgi:exonuclease III
VGQHTEWDDKTDNDDSRDSTSTTSFNASKQPYTLSTRQPCTSNKSTDDKQEFVISKILTQNAHGLRRRARDNDGNILLNTPFDYTRYEHLITTMKLKEIDVYFVQETWLEGDVFDETINGYHVFRHNGEIVSPHYYDGWKAAGARPPITTDAKGEFAGRFISLNIKLANNDRAGKQIRGKQGHNYLALTLISVYHPCTKTGDYDIYLRFLDTLDELLSKAPATSAIVMGADVNSNIGKLDGIASMEFRSVLGPHGLSRRNMKGESLLHVYLGHRLCVMNTFFETKLGSLGHSTWTNNRPTSTGIADSHMLDLLICSATLHKWTRNCCTKLDGLDSDHSAVALELNLTSIKYKAKSSLNRGDIYWRIICEEETHRTMYNKYLMQLTSRDMSYESFCDAVVRAGKITAMTVNQSCTGWYAASESILAPIQEKNRLRHRLHDCIDLSPDEISCTKDQLKLMNKQNHDLVELAKAWWYKGLCEKIHQMNMDPRVAWEHICLLTGGETAHHTLTINMAMRLGEWRSRIKCK